MSDYSTPLSIRDIRKHDLIYFTFNADRYEAYITRSLKYIIKCEIWYINNKKPAQTKEEMISQGCDEDTIKRRLDLFNRTQFDKSSLENVRNDLHCVD